MTASAAPACLVTGVPTAGGTELPPGIEAIDALVMTRALVVVGSAPTALPVPAVPSHVIDPGTAVGYRATFSARSEQREVPRYGAREPEGLGRGGGGGARAARRSNATVRSEPARGAEGSQHP